MNQDGVNLPVRSFVMTSINYYWDLKIFLCFWRVCQCCPVRYLLGRYICYHPMSKLPKMPKLPKMLKMLKMS